VRKTRPTAAPPTGPGTRKRRPCSNRLIGAWRSGCRSTVRGRQRVQRRVPSVCRYLLVLPPSPVGVGTRPVPGRRYGTWGVGLRGGYYQVTGTAFLADGITRSGDKTALRLIPFSLSVLYRADRIPHLRNIPLVPYLKAGLDGVVWTASRTGNSPSHTGFTPGGTAPRASRWA